MSAHINEGEPKNEKETRQELHDPTKPSNLPQVKASEILEELLKHRVVLHTLVERRFTSERQFLENQKDKILNVTDLYRIGLFYLEFKKGVQNLPRGINTSWEIQKLVAVAEKSVREVRDYLNDSGIYGFDILDDAQILTSENFELLLRNVNHKDELSFLLTIVNNKKQLSQENFEYILTRVNYLKEIKELILFMMPDVIINDRFYDDPNTNRNELSDIFAGAAYAVNYLEAFQTLSHNGISLKDSLLRSSFYHCRHLAPFVATLFIQFDFKLDKEEISLTLKEFYDNPVEIASLLANAQHYLNNTEKDTKKYDFQLNSNVIKFIFRNGKLLSDVPDTVSMFLLDNKHINSAAQFLTAFRQLQDAYVPIEPHLSLFENNATKADDIAKAIILAKENNIDLKKILNTEVKKDGYQIIRTKLSNLIVENPSIAINVINEMSYVTTLGVKLDNVNMCEDIYYTRQYARSINKVLEDLWQQNVTVKEADLINMYKELRHIIDDDVKYTTWGSSAIEACIYLCATGIATHELIMTTIVKQGSLYMPTELVSQFVGLQHVEGITINEVISQSFCSNLEIPREVTQGVFLLKKANTQQINDKEQSPKMFTDDNIKLLGVTFASLMKDDEDDKKLIDYFFDESKPNKKLLTSNFCEIMSKMIEVNALTQENLNILVKQPGLKERIQNISRLLGKEIISVNDLNEIFKQKKDVDATINILRELHDNHPSIKLDLNTIHKFKGNYDTLFDAIKILSKAEQVNREFIERNYTHLSDAEKPKPVILLSNDILKILAENPGDAFITSIKLINSHLSPADMKELKEAPLYESFINICNAANQLSRVKNPADQDIQKLPDELIVNIAKRYAGENMSAQTANKVADVFIRHSASTVQFYRDEKAKPVEPAQTKKID